jgi:hypothetical protein
MLALSRDLDVQYKTAFVLAHKLREAMAASVRGLRIGGEGRVAEIDGAYFGGHVRPENLAADRVDRRLSENKSGKRRAVVVMRGVAAARCRRCSPPKTQPCPASASVLPKERPSMPMRARLGTLCMPAFP